MSGLVFKPTHRISIGHTRTLVMLDADSINGDGPAYTREEWDADARADWERIGGEWLFQGRSNPGAERVTVRRVRS